MSCSALAFLNPYGDIGLFIAYLIAFYNIISLEEIRYSSLSTTSLFTFKRVYYRQGIEWTCVVNSHFKN